MSTKPLTRWRAVGAWQWRIEFKLADLWIGAFWSGNEAWVCLLPCLPVHIRYGMTFEQAVGWIEELRQRRKP